MSSSSTITTWVGEYIWVGSKSMLITENVSLHLNATSPLIAPNRHFCGKTFFMPVPRRACVPLVDVLLRILPGEVAVMAWLPQSRRAYLAVMPFWDVKTTGVTRVSIHKLLHEVRVWGLNILSLGWWCKIPSTYGRRSHVPRCGKIQPRRLSN